MTSRDHTPQGSPRFAMANPRGQTPTRTSSRFTPENNKFLTRGRVVCRHQGSPWRTLANPDELLAHGHLTAAPTTPPAPTEEQT